MLKRIFRLTREKDFQTIYRRGRYNATALLSVNVLPNKFGATKIGVVANKKVAKKAHDRNSVKRQAREIARLLLPRLKSGQSIIITLKQPALAASYQDIERDILASFKRLELFSENDQKNN